jgi:hypothetical protein
MAEVTSRDRMTLGEALRRLGPEATPPGSLSSADNYSSTSWDLNTNFPAAVALARDGWREKAEELERMMVQIRDLAPTGFSFGYDVAGECVDVGAYLAGVPECMITMEPPAVRNLSLVVNISARCSADARLLLNRGMAIASLVYSLQACAFGVSLRIAEWVSGDGNASSYHETMIEVNQPGEYIDPARLAYWLGHPAVLRRCIFRFNEQQPRAIRERYGFQSSSGYGTPSNPPASAFTGEGALEGGSILIPFPDSDDLHHYDTPQKALQRISQIVAEQGLKVQS